MMMVIMMVVEFYFGIHRVLHAELTDLRLALLRLYLPETLKLRLGDVRYMCWVPLQGLKRSVGDHVLPTVRV